MVLSKLGDLVPTNGAKQKSETWCLLMVLSKMNPSTASTMRSMIAEGIIVWRWLWCCRPITISACTCLCECENVSRLLYQISAWTCLRLLCGCENVSWLRCRQSQARAQISQVKLPRFTGEIENLWMIGPSLHNRLWMAKWTKTIPHCKSQEWWGILGNTLRYGLEHLSMLSSPQECMCRHRKCLCKLFDTNLLNWPKRLFPCLTVRQSRVRLTRTGWGGYIKTQSRYQWGWDGAIKTQSRYSGNQDPVEVLGQVLRSILWHVLNEFVLQDVH